MADIRTSHVTRACAALHTDGEGNVIPCPGYPHDAQPDPGAVAEQPELYDCPHCTDAVIDLDEHLTTCTARKADALADARRLLAEHEQRQTEACLAEIEAVLARYGRKLQISQPQITIVPA